MGQECRFSFIFKQIRKSPVRELHLRQNRTTETVNNSIDITDDRTVQRSIEGASQLKRLSHVLQINRICAVNQRALEKLDFQPQKINSYFETFFTRLHVQWPFVAVMRIESVFRTARLLYWTIVTVVPRLYSRWTYESLKPELRTLIAPVIISGNQGVETCQALLRSVVWLLDFSGPHTNPLFM